MTTSLFGLAADPTDVGEGRWGKIKFSIYMITVKRYPNAPTWLKPFTANHAIQFAEFVCQIVWNLRCQRVFRIPAAPLCAFAVKSSKAEENTPHVDKIISFICINYFQLWTTTKPPFPSNMTSTPKDNHIRFIVYY